MRNGLIILSLGRQSFEPVPTEAEASDPNPAPRASDPPAASDLARAQNEVLLTVGELLRGSSKPHPSHASLVRENELGLMISTADLTVNYLSSWPLVALQNRIQVFTRYAGMTFREVWRVEWGMGVMSLFSGCVADLAFQLGYIVRDVVTGKFIQWAEKWASRRRKGIGRVFVVNLAERCMDWTIWCLFLYPLYRYTLLQSLQLIPVRPLLPPPSFWIASLGHLHPRAVLSSPFIWVSAYAYFAQRLRDIVYIRVRAALPKPDNPSSASTAATLEFEGDMETEEARHQRRRRTRQSVPGEELVELIEPPTNIILSDIDSGQQYTVAVPPPIRTQERNSNRNEQELTPPASPRVDMSRSSTNDDLEDSTDIPPPRRRTAHLDTIQTPSRRSTAQTPSRQNSSNASPAVPVLPRTNTTPMLDTIVTPAPAPSSSTPITPAPITRPSTFPLDLDSLDHAVLPDIPLRTHFPPRTSSRPIPPLPQQSEHNTLPPGSTPPPLTTIDPPPPTKHKVTTLTTHPSESAAFHLADMASRLGGIVLETTMLRILARSFLGGTGELLVWGTREVGVGVLRKMGWALVVDAGFAWVSWEVAWGVCRWLA